MKTEQTFPAQPHDGMDSLSPAKSKPMLDRLLERNLLPDWLLRTGIRNLLAERLREEDRGGLEADQEHLLQKSTNLS